MMHLPATSATRLPARPGIKHRHPETGLQIAIADFLRIALPPSVAWSAFPAGGGGKARGGLLKAMGLTRGFPDLCFVHPETGVAHWIELKAPGGATSSEQKTVHALLLNSSSPVTVCRSIDQVEHFLRASGFPLLASVQGRAAA